MVCYPTLGGSGIVATELGIALAREENTEVHYITYDRPIRLPNKTERLFFHKVITPEYPLFHYQPYELALCSKLVEVIKAYQIQILHVHYAIPHAYVAYMAQQILKSQGIYIPIITTLHGTDITLIDHQTLYKPAVDFSINNSQAVTCVSESLKEDTLNFFNIYNHIEVIPNFIDTQDIKISHATQKSPTIQFIHISNFRAIKRVIDVVEIFYRVQLKFPNISLTLVGDGPDKPIISARIRSLNIVDKVNLIGKSDDIYSLLSGSDIFLLPSQSESFGLAALEAMAYGNAVISSNAGGIPEVNTHNRTGYLADVGDIQTMTNHAINLLENPDLLDSFKQNAQLQAKTFETKLIVNKYRILYNSLLKDTKPQIKIPCNTSIDAIGKHDE